MTSGNSKVRRINVLSLVLFLLCTKLPCGNGYIASTLGAGDKPHLSLIKHPGISSESHSGDRLNFRGGSNSGLGSGQRFSGESNEAELQTGGPTYTPFISSRALSNIPKFFEHLRENLEALEALEALQSDENAMAQRNLDESILSSDSKTNNVDTGNDEMKEAFYEKLAALGSGSRWQPASIGATPGVNGRQSNIRSFVHLPSEQENYHRRAHNYNPSWLYTNLGLGRRRRR